MYWIGVVCRDIPMYCVIYFIQKGEYHNLSADRICTSTYYRLHATKYSAYSFLC